MRKVPSLPAILASLLAASASAEPAPAGEPAVPAAVEAPPPAAPVPAAAPAVPAPAPIAPSVALEPRAAPRTADEPGRPESVEIQVRVLADRLADGLRDRPGQGRYERWAVMPLAEQGDEVAKRKLGQVLAAALETSLKADHGFLCVERMRLAALLKEIQLSQTGLLEESKAPEVGRMANADLLVVGSVGMLGDHYIVNVKAVSVQEAKVLAAAQVRIAAAGLVALSSQALVLRTRSDAVLRSVLIPGWGQLYNRQEEKAAVLMSAAAALAGAGILFRLLSGSAEGDYQSMRPDNPGRCSGQSPDQFSACVQGVRELAESRAQTSNYLFFGLAAVYAYSLLDAYLSGYKPDASTRSLYADFGPAPSGGGVSVRGAF